MTRLLILTAGFGEGHNAAARNLAAAAEAAGGAGTARICDIFEMAAPRFNAVARRGYINLINRAPKLWSAAYGWIDRHAILPGGLIFLRREMRVLRALLATEQPEVICSTYPVYAFMLERIAAEGGPRIRHYNVVTDSISINSLWWRAPCAGWFVPNDDSAEVMRRIGIAGDALHVSGFPVPAFFSENNRLQPPDLSTGGRPRVLYIINSGTRDAEATARRLFSEPEWEITCAVGRDEGLRLRLEKIARQKNARATLLGWTNQIPHLLMTHHAVISKAGGATTQEAIAARCPMIVNQVVPGQEEGNYELLRRHHAGALAETPDAVMHTLRAAFAHGGEGWQRWRTAITALAQPDAAPFIIRHVLPAMPATVPAHG